MSFSLMYISISSLFPGFIIPLMFSDPALISLLYSHFNILSFSFVSEISLAAFFYLFLDLLFDLFGGFFLAQMPFSSGSWAKWLKKSCFAFLYARLARFLLMLLFMFLSIVFCLLLIPLSVFLFFCFVTFLWNVCS